MICHQHSRNQDFTTLWITFFPPEILSDTFVVTNTGERGLQTVDCDVFPDCQWYGVPGPGEVHTQRSGCSELHVSSVEHDSTLACMSCILYSLPVFTRIDSHLVIKITDFGLSEDVFVRNYFRQGTNEEVYS